MVCRVGKRRLVTLSQGVPTPPSGYVFLVGADGAYLIDADGAYLIEVI